MRLAAALLFTAAVAAAYVPAGGSSSGTSALPAAAPERAWASHVGSWMLMAHYNLFLRYTNQDPFDAGARGDDAFDAPNWFMAMAGRDAGPGAFSGRAMLSLDAVTEGGDGYPLLFQTGETWEGAPLVDRQHPHDLVAELSASYTLPLGDDAALFAYAAYPGEPALGPPAFIHRPSAASNPDAPLGHHWQDSTHIAWGVGTAGVQYHWLTLEGSAFTGREPDERRYEPDGPRFDSFCGRVTVTPTGNLALQLSYGFLSSPEALHDDDDVTRATASALYSGALANGATYDLSAVWGMNRGADAGSPSHSLLLEAGVGLGRVSWYSRAEYVQKPAGELALGTHAPDDLVNVGAGTAGCAVRLLTFGGTDLSVGGQGTVYAVAAAAADEYGANAVALEVYFRLCPALAAPAPHHHHGGEM